MKTVNVAAPLPPLMDDGLNDAVIPGGRVALRFTVPENPLTEPTATVITAAPST